MRRTRCGRADGPPKLGERLPAGGWRRLLALWGFAPVPFFSAGYEEFRG